MEKAVEVNPVYIPYLTDDTRTQIYFGGSASGKSFFEAQRAVLDLLGIEGRPPRNYLVCRSVAKTLRNSTYNQIVKAIDDMGLRGQFNITKSEMAITCRKNGRQILFAGLDDPEKVKSLTPAVGVLTDIWIEEATEVSKEAYKQLTKRLRGVDGGVAKRITLSFNPILKGHWIYKEFFGGWEDGKDVYRDKNLVILKTTYKDNHFLTADDIDALENEADRYYYDVYTLGNWGMLGKVIFKNVEVQDLSELMPSFDKIYNGLDFGFSEDPNALVRAHVNTAAKEIYVFEELYEHGMFDDELASVLKSRIGDQYVVCDSSQPKSIADLQRRGVRALPALKGPDSVNYGIRFLQGYKLIVHAACLHMRNELALYHWAEDKNGNALQRPVDRDNHLIDALRYALEEIMHQTAGGAARRI